MREEELRSGQDGLGSGAELGELPCLKLPSEQRAGLATRQTPDQKAPWTKWAFRQAWVLLESFCEEVLCSPGALLCSP